MAKISTPLSQINIKENVQTPVSLPKKKNFIVLEVSHFEKSDSATVHIKPYNSIYIGPCYLHGTTVFSFGRKRPSRISTPTSIPAIELLARVEQLTLLTKAENAGLLSAAEKAGLSHSSMEKLGLLSKAEELGVLSAATEPGTPAALLSLGLGLLLLGPFCA